MANYHLSLVLFAALIGLLGLALVKVRATVSSPLSKLPGPTVSKWTRLRLKYEILSGNRAFYVHDLHKKYGPVVRISPEEVSLADVQAAKTIYRVGGPYLKTPFYDAFTGNYTYANLFSTRDKALHNHNRKLQSHHFSEKWVKRMEPSITKNIQLAVERMGEDVERQGWTDIFKWFTFMATDVIGEASFGESFRMLQTGKENQYSNDLEMIASRAIFRTEFPNLVAAMSRIPFGPSQKIGGAVKRMNEYGEQSLARYERWRDADPENVKPTLMTKLYDAIERGEYERARLGIDARGHIVAGTDTTAFTTTYAVWLLAKHPQIEHELIRAISALPPEFDDEDLRSIGLLNNVVQEALRLGGAVGSALPRAVPPGGAEFRGYFIPEGTTVGLQAWTMHRKPDVWAEPEAFDPSRWEEPTKDMKDCFVAFGGGSRICIGMHLAQLEIRHSLARFYRAFEGGVKPAAAEGFTEADMKLASHFLMQPRGRRCLMQPRKTGM